MGYLKRQKLSEHFLSREASAIRLAQMEFMKRNDNTEAVNVAIGNVSLPMHPAMQKRMFNLGSSESPFKDGIVKYSPSVGLEETNGAFLHAIGSGRFNVKDLYSQVTDGGSMAMELVILGVCGPAGSKEKPLLLIDPAYTNYKAMAERVGRATVSVRRHLRDNGEFALPDIAEMEKAIKVYRPGALLVIPYDNPTGQFFDQKTLIEIGRLCVQYNIWLVSDAAYRQLYYGKKEMSSIWGITEGEVPGIKGRRISIESASKIWNACGLRIGALVTDNKEFHEKAVAEFTANLCAPIIDQYIFGALAHVSNAELSEWYSKQRKYYYQMMSKLALKMKEELPDAIISLPQASLYSVIDVRNIVGADFDAKDFVMYCAREGKVELKGRETTLLVSPMAGFYSVREGEENPGRTQMRIAYVETPEKMMKVPELFAKLLRQYLQQ